LVQAAKRGEDVVISVRGEPAVRLVPLKGPNADDRAKWLQDLRELRKKYTLRVATRRETQKMWDELRADRF